VREKLQSGQSAPRTLLSRRKGKRVLRREAFERLCIRKEKAACGIAMAAWLSRSIREHSYAEPLNVGQRSCVRLRNALRALPQMDSALL
jgi:hypothetical protein